MSVKRLAIALLAGLVLAGGLAGAGVFAASRGWRPPEWLGFLAYAAGGTRAVDVGLFCHEHGVPEKFCTLCHPELTDKLLLCTEHGNIPEDVCTLCHPENEQKYGLKMMCRDHGVPEPFCVKCNPGIAAGQAASDWCPEHGLPESLCTLCDPGLAAKVAMCAQHGVPEALCTICTPELADNFVTCPDHKLPVAFCPPDSPCVERFKELCADGRCVFPQGACPNGLCAVSAKPAGKEGAATLPRVRFASPAIAAKSGIETAPAESRRSATSIVANAEVGYDETRIAHVRPRVAGIVHGARASVGDVVQKGEVLAVIDSAELGQAKADLLSAAPMVELWQANAERLRGLGDKGVVAGKRLLEAEAQLRRARAQVLRARQKLQNLGVPSFEIGALADEPESERNHLEIVAPQDGVVVERHVVAGEAVQATSELLVVADTSTMWVHIDLYERDLSNVAVGQAVTFQTPGLAPTTFRGRVAWVDRQVNRKTRTIHVRANVSNARDLLRANMFGTATIQVGGEREALAVPAAAVQWEGSSYVVFVKKEADLYEPRRVLTGRRLNDYVELAWADLNPGEPIVTTGSFLLKTEIMKGAIGAGCCGE